MVGGSWRVVGGCLRWLEVVEGCWMVVGGYLREVGEE
jgi:hypothetical protein